MKVIKNAEVLRSNYIPEKLLFRDDLITDINEKILIGTGNTLIHGLTGTGKTASVVNALKNHEDIILIFVNCVSHNTFAAITKRVIEEIKPYQLYNERGKSTAQLSDDLTKTLKIKRNKKLVFVFDEVDKLINKERDHQQVLSVIVESTISNIILISNDTNALKNLDPRIESRLSPERKFVKPYNAGEIFQILLSRAMEGLEPESYDPPAILKIARWIYNTSADIREALNLLYTISSTAQRNGSKITSELFEDAKHKVGEIEFDEIFWEFPLHQRIIIGCIAKLSHDEQEGYAEHKKLYALYEKTLEEINLKEGGNNDTIYEPVGYRQFERFLKKIELRKLIEITSRTPRNRKGRLVVSFPKFDAERFIKQYLIKPVEIDDYALPLGGGVR